MERNTTAKKIIFLVLDMLLIMGAIVGVLTIDRGQWIISNPAFYQPPEEAVQENAVIPVTGANAGVDDPAKDLPQTGGGCPAHSLSAGPEW